MPKFCVEVSVGDDEAQRVYIVEAPAPAYARWTAAEHVRGLVSAVVSHKFNDAEASLEIENWTYLGHEFDGELTYDKGLEEGKAEMPCFCGTPNAYRCPKHVNPVR